MGSNERVVLKKPVDWDELYPGRFIKYGDLKGKQVTLQVADIDLEELEGNKGKEIKGILLFEKTTKGLPLNKTNGTCIREMFGRKLPDWPGKRVTFYPTIDGGEECVRVWGSPDIDADITFMLELPRKKPRKITLHKVVPGKKGQEPDPPPDQDDDREPGADDGS